MVRGDPVCRKEDCSQYDIGVVFTEISSYSDQDKFKFIENVWKPGELFDFPASVECSNSNRHFVWSNAPAPTPEDYYRINLTTDFLNHALMQLETRFEDAVFVCYKGFSVIPSILLATGPIWKDNVREFCNHYRQDIPNYAGLPAELLVWERMWKGKSDRREDIPDSIDATLEQIDKVAYVNIYTILQILKTIPISSASCERSISTLRNLKSVLTRPNHFLH